MAAVFLVPWLDQCAAIAESGGVNPGYLRARCAVWLYALLALLCFDVGSVFARNAIFNVRDFGATGQKTDDARPALQKAIDACAAAKGGTVLIPPGEYTSGTLHLRSHVRVEIAGGATVFASPDPMAYEFKDISAKAALFFGEDLTNVTITGAGTVDGQAAYDWREDNFESGYPHKDSMIKLGKPLLRSFPKDFPNRTIYPRLVWLGNCRDVTFTGLKWVHSPSWTITLYRCEHAHFEGLYVYSSLKEAVWADGIDLDGCKDVRITRCRLETGDDCIVFISSKSWGPSYPCENIRVSQCKLSSASAGVKFSEGNLDGVRHVRVTDCILTNVNRGFVFSTTLGGDIRDVELSDLRIYCNRFDWFWAGDAQPFFFRVTRLSEFNKEAPKPGERPPGKIADIRVRNVTALAKGTCRFFGHADNPMDGLTLENVKLTVTCDPTAPFDYADHAVHFRDVKNVQISGLEVNWQQPYLPAWQSALCFERVHDLRLNRFTGRGAPDSNAPAIALDQVANAEVRHNVAADGTTTFIKVTGKESRDISIRDNNLRRAGAAYLVDSEVPANAIRLK